MRQGLAVLWGLVCATLWAGSLILITPLVLIHLVVTLACTTFLAILVHWLIVGALFGETGDLADEPLEILLFVMLCGAAWLGSVLTVWERFDLGARFSLSAGDSHGSARLAGAADIAPLRTARDGLLIGRNPNWPHDLLAYDGPAHLLTLAPTRSGKGVGTVIPNLLWANRSVLVVDPKGENARIAGAARQAYGRLHVLDPFGITDHPSSAYNPLDRLDPDGLDLGEEAATLADALVMDPPGQVKEAHWNEEAKALLAGLILFTVCHEEPKRRTLASVREYLTLPPDRFQELLRLMQESPVAHGLIARAANRHLGKADREAASVLSNAQRHTHFLDSPRMTAALGRSEFAFSDLRHETVSVFLVLPPDRLDTYARWLRLLIGQALQEVARDAQAPDGADSAAERPQTPILFLLDEFRRPRSPGRHRARHGPDGRLWAAALANPAGSEPAPRSL